MSFDHIVDICLNHAFGICSEEFPKYRRETYYLVLFLFFYEKKTKMIIQIIYDAIIIINVQMNQG